MSRRIILVDIGTGLTLRGMLPSVALFAAYTATLKASGGQAPYTYTIVAGTLPDGLYLDAATGIISGTASAAGTASFTVRATDLSGAHVDRPYSITVIAEPLSLSGAAPAWTVGTPYSYTYIAEHGVPPYAWSLASGSLPAGITLDAGTGEISGTPTEAAAPSWTVRVTDEAGTSIDLRDNVTLQLLGAFADATVGTAYSSDLAINGGDLPYSDPRVTVGTLPAGLALSIVGGKLRLSGTPSAAATSNFTAAVDSGDGQTATSAQSIVTDAAASDPYWANVVALLHLDGINGSTVVTDEVDNTPWTVNGDAHISNAATLFGGNCLALDGTGDYLSTLYAEKYDIPGDFTIEAFVNPSSVAAGSYYSVCSKRSISTNGWSFETGSNDAAGKIRFRGNFGGTWSDFWAQSTADAIAASQFTHIAVTRSGNTLRTFANGLMVGSSIVSGGLLNSLDNLRVGSSKNGGENFFSGFLRELRITKGVARYIADFTPPDAPFPNS
jgi:hypothetical protein